MNPLALAKLFATLKNPTAMVSMASVLPSTEGLEEYKPTDLDMLADSGHLFDGEFVKSPREYFFEDFALSPGNELVSPFGGLGTPSIPDNTYMSLTDDDLDLLAKNTKKWGTMPGVVPRLEDLGIDITPFDPSGEDLII